MGFEEGDIFPVKKLSAVLGGLGTLYGSLIGAIVIYLAKNWWIGDVIRALSP
ncbi:hypothetical protein [Archaeoglobus sp.]